MTMRKLLAILATLAIMCTVLPLSALFSASADANNLIANGDFADGLGKWYSSGGTSIEAVDGALHGDYNESWGFIGYDITLEPNTDYVLSFDAKSINAGGVTAKLNKTDWTGTVQKQTFQFGAEWTTYTWAFNSGTYGPMWLYFQSECEASANQEIWLDNISLVKAEGGDTPAEPETPVEGNLIANGDFETGDASGWETWQNTVIEADAAKGGAYGAHLIGTGGWGGLLNQTIAVEAGKEYKLSFWINVNAVGVNLQVKDGSGKSIEGAGGWFDGNKKDTQVEYIFTATDNSVFLNFCGSGSAPEDVYVDNFSLVATGNGAPEADDALIKNGDFETGSLSPWDNLWGSCPTAEVIEGGKDSAYALNIVSGQWKHVRQTGIAVEANTTYKITAWAKNAANMCLLVKDGGDSKDIVNSGVNAGSEWTQFTAEFNTGSYTTIIFSLMGGAEEAYGIFDNIVMEKIGSTEPDEPVEPDEPDEPDEPVTPPIGGLLNATFDTDEFDGVMSTSDISVADGELQFNVTKDWGNIYAELAVEANTDYKVSFRAKSKLGKSVWVKFHKADWTGDICQETAGLSTSWKEYSYTMNSGDNTSVWLLVQYAGYAAEGEVVWFDYITVEKIGGSTPDTPDEPVDSALINGDFENGSEGWELGSSASITEDDAHTGKASLQLENPGQWAAAAVQNLAVKADTDYVIEMWTKRVKGTGAFNLYMMDAADNRNLTVVEGQNWFNTADKDWTKHTLVINTGVATEIIVKWSAEVANAGILLIDDMTISEKNAPAPTGGLITNGDFETGDNTGWEFWQQTVVSEEAAHSGKYGVNLLGDGGWGGFLNQNFKAEVGETYIITLWVCINNSGANLQIKNATKVEGECDNTYLDPNELNAGWVMRKFTVVADAETITLNFCGGGTKKAEDIYIDDITVTKKGETPAGEETYPIKNAGFETGDLTGWQNLWNSCVVGFDTPGHDKSNYALNFEGPGAWKQVRQDGIPVEPNTDYTLIAYVKNPLNINLVVKTGNDSANIADHGVANDLSNTWIRQEVSFNSGSETEVCVLIISNEAGMGTAIVDNVQIYKKGEEPAEPEPDAPATEGPTQLNSFGVVVNRPASADKNLILNGSFEDAEGGQWQSVISDTLYVVDDETAPSGNKSLFFNTSGVTENNKVIFYLDVEPNTDYVFSAWVKGAFISDTNRFNATIGTTDWKDNFMTYPDALFSTKARQIVPTAWDNEWHLRSVGFNSGVNTKIGIGFAGAESQMWIDDIALFTIDSGVKYVDPVQSSGIASSIMLPEEGYCDEKDNLIAGGDMDSAESKEFWSSAMGYGNGFISFAENKYEYGTSMKYTGSEDSCDTHMIKWIDVKPNTDYTFAVSVRVVHSGGKLILIDGKKRDCQAFVMIDFDTLSYGNDWFTVTLHFDTKEFDRIGIAVVDGGGVALIDNMRLFESSKRIDAEDATDVEFVKPPYAYGSDKDPHFIPGFGGDEPGIGGGTSPDTGVSVVGAALAVALVPASAAVAFKLRRKKEDEE